MPNEPLQPFAPPTGVAENLHRIMGITPTEIVWWILYAVCFYWVIYTLVAVYHWFRYSHASWLTLPAVALHLLVSYTLIVYALTGNFIIPFL